MLLIILASPLPRTESCGRGRSSNQTALNRPVLSFGKCFVEHSGVKMEFYGKMLPKCPETGRSRSCRKGISGAEMSPDDQKRVLPFPWLYGNMCSDRETPESPSPEELTFETFTLPKLSDRWVAFSSSGKNVIGGGVLFPELNRKYVLFFALHESRFLLNCRCECQRKS